MKLKIDFEHLKEKRWLKDLLVAVPLFALSLVILCSRVLFVLGKEKNGVG